MTANRTGGTLEVEPQAQVITVTLIEENRLVRDGITVLLNRFADIRVVAVHPDESDSLRKGARPQVILLDLGFENGNSLSVAKRIIKTFSGTRVVVMDLFPSDQEIVEFIRAGVSGFIMKDATVEAVVGTIRTVAAGKPSLPAEMTGRLFSEIASDAASRSTVERVQDAVLLTQREREVVSLIAKALSNKAIANRMSITTHTVKSHLRNIMDKLTVHTRLQVAAYAHGTSPARPIEAATDRRDESTPQNETVPGRARIMIQRSPTAERDRRIHRNLRDPREKGSRRAEHAPRGAGIQSGHSVLMRGRAGALSLG